jgi:hypothetical protein
MARPQLRAQLEGGLKLNLNNLARRGFVRPGAATGPIGIRWSSDYWGEIATGLIWANMTDTRQGWFQIKIGELNQKIILTAQKRQFGGRQWYFVCPYANRRASVLWMPPGARAFACRQKWGTRRVGYATQFLGRDDRAHRGQAKINSRLCSIGGFDPDEWSFPPKPKWMRWATYKRAEQKFDHYEGVLDEGIPILLAKLGTRFGIKY